MPNPSQQPPASSKAPNHDSKDIDVLYTFKIKVESQNFDRECMKDKISNPSQEPPASSKAPNQELKDMDMLFLP